MEGEKCQEKHSQNHESFSHGQYHQGPIPCTEGQVIVLSFMLNIDCSVLQPIYLDTCVKVREWEDMASYNPFEELFYLV